MSPDETPAAAAARPQRSPRRLILAGWVLAGVALVMFLIVQRIAQPASTRPSAGVNGPAPAFELEMLGGGRLTFASLRGRPIVLNFWASWCVPCREEAPLLNDAAARWPRVQFVGVVYQDSTEGARKFTQEFRQTYPAVLDPSGRTAIDYGVVGIPITFFIDSGGIIRSRQVGGLRAEDLRRQIEAILP